MRESITYPDLEDDGLGQVRHGRPAAGRPQMLAQERLLDVLPKIFLCSAKELHVAKLRLALAAAPLAVCPGPGNYRDLIVVWVAGGGLPIDGEGAERILGIVPSPL